MDEIRATAQKEQQLLKAQYATLAAELEEARQAAADAVGEQADAAQQRSAEMEAQVGAAAVPAPASPWCWHV